LRVVTMLLCANEVGGPNNQNFSLNAAAWALRRWLRCKHAKWTVEPSTGDVCPAALGGACFRV
jgi:hypothetical protein